MLFEYTEKDDLRSTWLETAHYNEVTMELAVTMKNGKTYIYTNVPWATYEDLVKVYSAGSYYNDYIRGFYDNKYGDAVVVRAFQRYTEQEAKKMAEQPKQKAYTVRAVVAFEAEVTAGSLDEAVKAFLESNKDVPGLEIKEVVVPFGK